MPIYRHECSGCGVEATDLFGLRDDPPRCCGQTMTRLMPRRVVGRVMPDTDGAHVGSGFAPPSTSGEDAPVTIASASVAPPASIEGQFDAADPLALPLAGKPRPKRYSDSTAAERDEYWHDTTQAMTAWQTNGLESDGVQPDAARRTAEQTQQQMSARARADLVRADGLT